MEKNIYDVEALISMLGFNRLDTKIAKFIKQFIPPPLIRINREIDIKYEYIEFRKMGFCLYFENDILDSIFLYSDIKDYDYCKYESSLPLCIFFEQTKAELIDLIGEPDIKGGGENDPFLGYIPCWVKYKLDKYTLHVEFTPDLKKIQLITLMLLQ